MLNSIGLPITSDGTCPKCRAVLTHAFNGLAVNLTGDELQYGSWRLTCENCEFKTEMILPIGGAIYPVFEVSK